MLFASPLQFVSLLLRSSVTRKNRQMSTKVAQKDFTKKLKILAPLQNCLRM